MVADISIQEVLAMQKAPPGKYRVLLVDTFANPPYGDPCVLADCDDKEAAVKLATAHGGPMLPCYVYDETGNCLHCEPANS
jgi:hypothetical protein